MKRGSQDARAKPRAREGNSPDRPPRPPSPRRVAKDVRARRQPGRWLRSSHPSKECVTAHWPSARAPTIHGAKRGAEAAGWKARPPSVGELPARGEAGPARARGARGSEDAGTSSESGVGTPTAECPRFPGEGPSSQGQSGPKGRPPGAPEGRQVDIPAPRAAGARATAPEGPAGFWTPPSGRKAWEAVWRTGARRGPRKARALSNRRAPVPQTDAGGPAEHAEADGATAAKELGKTAP